MDQRGYIGLIVTIFIVSLIISAGFVITLSYAPRVKRQADKLAEDGSMKQLRRTGRAIGRAATGDDQAGDNPADSTKKAVHQQVLSDLRRLMNIRAETVQKQWGKLADRFAPDTPGHEAGAKTATQLANSIARASVVVNQQDGVVRLKDDRDALAVPVLATITDKSGQKHKGRLAVLVSYARPGSGSSRRIEHLSVEIRGVTKRRTVARPLREYQAALNSLAPR